MPEPPDPEGSPGAADARAPVVSSTALDAGRPAPTRSADEPVDEGSSGPEVPDTRGDGHAGGEVESWLDRNLTARRLRTAEGALTLLVVGVCGAFVFAQLQPQLLLSDTTPAGGDMGAHVWAPAYLRDVLVPDGRLAGWTPDWYAGFPAMQFYMVVPMLAIALLSYVLPYGVAFKLVTVSGIVSLPLAAYAFGRLNRLAFPLPALLAVAATVFVFDRSFSIYGGNAASTLAGEFAFSISLSLAVLYLGVVGRGLVDGTHRALAAVLLALTGLCHLIPAFFAITGTAAWFLVWAGRDLIEAVGSLDPQRWQQLGRSLWARARWVLTMGPVAGLLAAFWILPFYAKSRYLNDMGWVREDEVVDFLFWRDGISGGGLIDYPTLALVLAFAAFGGAVSVALRSRVGVFLTAMVVVSGLAFVLVPQGRLWNTRLLPFYYLCLLLLAAVGIGLVPRLLGRVRARRAIGIGAAVFTLGLQVLLLWQPADLLWVHVGSGDPAVFWGQRWEPWFYVGVLVVTLVAAAELVDRPRQARRTASWVLVGVAVLAQLAVVASDALDVGTRLGAYALALLALVAFAAVLEVIEAVRGERGRPGWLGPVTRLAAVTGGVVVVWLYLALPLRGLGFLGATDPSDGSYHLSIAGIDLVGTTDDSFVDSWAAWNYAGYEAPCDPEAGDPCGPGEKPYFPEYHAVVTTMAEVGEEHGCGRAMWEYSSDLDRYGTPMALMLLPHWTDGCIGSMEGLYFEASTTTPYHFINQDELSEAGSNAQRGMPYVQGIPTEADFDRGIRHLQMLGVRYYMAHTDTMTSYAEVHPALTEVATAPAMCLPELCPDGVDDPPVRWMVFEIADSPLVAPLEHQPVVLTGVGDGHTCESAPEADDGRRCEGWLDPAVDWYVDPALWDVPLTEDGPEDWDRIQVDEWVETHEAPRTPVEQAAVSDIVEENDRISFTVDQVGTPVLVKASYFPNWNASGAEGPYRVTPNLMVVVPTEREVELTYGWVGVDIVAWVATLVGIALLVLLARRAVVHIPPGPVAAWRSGSPGSE